MSKRLVGVLSLAAACAGTQPKSAAPLCDQEGSPACGNVGQPGRSHDPTPIVVARPVIEATTQLEKPAKPVIKRALLAPAVSGNEHLTVARPLVGAEQEPMCGNAMSKGGQHTCK